MLRARLCLVCVALVMGGCVANKASKPTCSEAVRSLVAAFQDYVDRFAGQTAEDLIDAPSPPSRKGVVGAVARFRREVSEAGCAAGPTREELELQLGSLRGRGFIAETIATSMRSTFLTALTGTSERPDERHVKPTDDLREAIASVVPGSRIILEAGEFRVDAPIVIFEGITLTGRGKDETRIISTARGAALIFLGSGVLGVESLSIGHEGDAAASIAVMRTGSYRITDSRFSGAKKDANGGGIGLVVGAESSADERTIRAMSISSSEFINNQESGIVVGGVDAPVIDSVTIDQSGNCGICYIGSVGGDVKNSSFLRNAAGIAILSTAKPLIRGNRFVENATGIQVRDAATPSIVENRFEANSVAAIVMAGSGGTANSNTCVNQPLGILVLVGAAPSLDGNACSVKKQ